MPKQQTPRPLDPLQKTEQVPPSLAPFPYGDYQKAKAALINALAGPRFYAQVIAHSGMGKTSLLDDLQSELKSGCGTVVYLSSSKASAQGVIRAVSAALHLPSKMHYLESVRILGNAMGAHQHPILLWLDEAHAVDAQTLTEIRMLAESGGRGQLLFSTVFCGLITLKNHLESPDLFPLRRRISLRLELSGLIRAELESFLTHRFGSAEATRIDPESLDELFERTQAVPGVMDAVVRHAVSLSEHGHAVSSLALKQALDTYGL